MGIVRRCHVSSESCLGRTQVRARKFLVNAQLDSGHGERGRDKSLRTHLTCLKVAQRVFPHSFGHQKEKTYHPEREEQTNVVLNVLDPLSCNRKIGRLTRMYLISSENHFAQNDCFLFQRVRKWVKDGSDHRLRPFPLLRLTYPYTPHHGFCSEKNLNGEPG